MINRLLLLCIAIGFINCVLGQTSVPGCPGFTFSTVIPVTIIEYYSTTVTATVTSTIIDTTSILETITTTLPGERITVIDTTSIIKSTTLTLSGIPTTVIDTTSIIEPTTVTIPGGKTTIIDTTSIIEPTTVTIPGGETTIIDTTSIMEPTTVTIPGGETTIIDTTSIIEPTTITTPGGQITFIVTTSEPTTITIPGVQTTVTVEESTAGPLTPENPIVTRTSTIIWTLTDEFVTDLGARTTAAAITSEINVCPAPTNSISVTPQDTGPDALWGCSPGFICNPPKPDHCDIWASPPSYDFVCDKKDCERAPPFSDISWPAGTISHYPITDYFNLNPRAFGLDYTIFLDSNDLAVREWRSPHAVGPRMPAKRIVSNIPAVCYAPCNNCIIEAQRIGKAPFLCNSNSAFESDLAACQACVMANSNITGSIKAYLPSAFLPFVTFCEEQTAKPESVSSSRSPATTSPLVTRSYSVASSTEAPQTSTTSSKPTPVTSDSTPKFQFSFVILLSCSMLYIF